MGKILVCDLKVTIGHSFESVQATPLRRFNLFRFGDHRLNFLGRNVSPFHPSPSMAIVAKGFRHRIGQCGSDMCLHRRHIVHVDLDRGGLLNQTHADHEPMAPVFP